MKVKKTLVDLFREINRLTKISGHPEQPLHDDEKSQASKHQPAEREVQVQVVSVEEK